VREPRNQVLGESVGGNSKVGKLKKFWKEDAWKKTGLAKIRPSPFWIHAVIYVEESFVKGGELPEQKVR